MLIQKEEEKEENFSKYYVRKNWWDKELIFLIDLNYRVVINNEAQYKYYEQLTEIGERIEQCYKKSQLSQLMKEKALDIMSLIKQDKKLYKEQLDIYISNGKYYAGVLEKFEWDYRLSSTKESKELIIDLAASIQQLVGDSLVNALKFQKLTKKRIIQYATFLHKLTLSLNNSN